MRKRQGGVKAVGKLTGADIRTLVATIEWDDPQGKDCSPKRARSCSYREPDRRVRDFDITLTPLEKMAFGDTKEGTFAIRIAAGAGGAGEKTHRPHPNAPG